MSAVNSILELIGNTPLVKLNNITKGIDAKVMVKLEYLNPSGSLKDRIALTMIEEAEKAGKLHACMNIVRSKCVVAVNQAKKLSKGKTVVTVYPIVWIGTSPIK